MEDSITNFRSAAEKTFKFSKPNTEFRNEMDDLIGEYFINIFFNFTYINYLEVRNYRITAPIEVTFNWINKFQKIKKLTWTEVGNNQMHVFYVLNLCSWQSFWNVLLNLNVMKNKRSLMLVSFINLNYLTY